MTPLSAATDGSDSLLSTTTLNRPIPQRAGTGKLENRAPVTLAGIQSPSASATSSPRSSSRHSQSTQEQQRNPSSRNTSPASFDSHNNAPRQTILASFAPRVACFASEDTDDVAKEKGYPGGFHSLLRPFAEHVPGKVVIRDSIGASKAWDDFGIRLIQYKEEPRAVASSIGQLVSHQMDSEDDHPEQRRSSDPPSIENLWQSSLEAMITRSIRAAQGDESTPGPTGLADELYSRRSSAPAPAYIQYLRKLLSETVQEPYETFSHPVACIIAVSSRSSAPLEKIRQLYSYSGRANNAIPPWVAVDYLRYYVLVHDEDHDDIVKSTALFDLMKRHFGLHCYLLRIRSRPCLETDSEAIESPRCHWKTSDEELSEMKEYGEYPCIWSMHKLTLEDHDNGSPSSQYIFETDAIAIRSFVREMVTQSILPFMESRVVTWNDQVASKRRGIGGRFMSLSKRWTGFGSAKGAGTATGTGQNAPNSNFDPSKGYYSPEAPEAIMRQLADYSFMLRDYKLAYSTYDSVRTDFSNDKAWAYHASANELAGVSFLLIPQLLSTRARSEVVDQRIEAAVYSYLTRRSLPFGAIRCILLTIELLVGRGPSTAEDAAKWAMKSLELGILSPILQVLMTERVADIRHSEEGSGMLSLGSRRRQAALWNTLAAALWTRLGEHGPASSRLEMARKTMDRLGDHATNVPFPKMRLLYSRLESKKSDLDLEDQPLIELDSATPANSHMDGTLVDLTEPPKHEELSGDFMPTDDGGFSAIEANHPDFEKAPLG
ncbi:MAG: hypothetical protein Q9168_001715 [Polycauliona sp. 1 TL-2023]